MTWLNISTKMHQPFFFGFSNKTHCLFSSFHTVPEHECLSFSNSWKQQVQRLQWRIQTRLWCVWAVEDSSGDPCWTGGRCWESRFSRTLINFRKLLPNHSKHSHCLCVPHHHSLVCFQKQRKKTNEALVTVIWLNNNTVIEEQVPHEQAFSIHFTSVMWFISQSNRSLKNIDLSIGNRLVKIYK